MSRSRADWASARSSKDFAPPTPQVLPNPEQAMKEAEERLATAHPSLRDKDKPVKRAPTERTMRMDKLDGRAPIPGVIFHPAPRHAELLPANMVSTLGTKSSMVRLEQFWAANVRDKVYDSTFFTKYVAMPASGVPPRGSRTSSLHITPEGARQTEPDTYTRYVVHFFNADDNIVPGSALFMERVTAEDYVHHVWGTLVALSKASYDTYKHRNFDGLRALQGPGSAWGHFDSRGAWTGFAPVGAAIVQVKEVARWMGELARYGPIVQVGADVAWMRRFDDPTPELEYYARGSMQMLQVMYLTMSELTRRVAEDDTPGNSELGELVEIGNSSWWDPCSKVQYNLFLELNRLPEEWFADIPADQVKTQRNTGVAAVVPIVEFTTLLPRDDLPMNRVAACAWALFDNTDVAREWGMMQAVRVCHANGTTPEMLAWPHAHGVGMNVCSLVVVDRWTRESIKKKNWLMPGHDHDLLVEVSSVQPAAEIGYTAASGVSIGVPGTADEKEVNRKNANQTRGGYGEMTDPEAIEQALSEMFLQPVPKQNANGGKAKVDSRTPRIPRFRNSKGEGVTAENFMV